MWPDLTKASFHKHNGKADISLPFDFYINELTIHVCIIANGPLVYFSLGLILVFKIVHDVSMHVCVSAPEGIHVNGSWISQIVNNLMAKFSGQSYGSFQLCGWLFSHTKRSPKHSSTSDRPESMARQTYRHYSIVQWINSPYVYHCQWFIGLLSWGLSDMLDYLQ